MTQAPQGLSWDGKLVKAAMVIVAVFMVIGVLAPAPAQATEGSLRVIVVTEATHLDDVVDHVASVGGEVTQRLALINGFAATIPASTAGAVASHPHVVSLVEDGTVDLLGTSDKAEEDDEQEESKEARELDEAQEDADEAEEAAEEAAERAAAARAEAERAAAAVATSSEEDKKDAEKAAKKADEAAKKAEDDAEKAAKKADEAAEKVAEKAEELAEKAQKDAAKALADAQEARQDEHDAVVRDYEQASRDLESTLEDLLEVQARAEKRYLKKAEKAEKKPSTKTLAELAEAEAELAAATEQVAEIEKELEVARGRLDSASEQARKAAFSLMEETLKSVKVDAYWSEGFTGAGVDVAVIDSGVAPVAGLAYARKVVNGPDLSFDSQHDNTRYLDGFGHGTHMAGIIAGNDDPTSPPSMARVKTDFLGVAPDARIVNVKVADHNGAVDVSQVIAALDWVVQHRTDNGLNIRVINLSFGTSGVQDYQLDPLSFAVEQAWHHGIVVVVAAGNDGNAGELRNPATNPFVIAVGAVDSNGTIENDDDHVTDFSNCGVGGSRAIDVYAPGQSLLSLRVPGSTIDLMHPEAVVHDRFFKGSGTSQATAVVSGLAALILDQRPDATPDQVKALLTGSAKSVRGISNDCLTGGVVHLGATFDTPTPVSVQAHVRSTGLGLLDPARGEQRAIIDNVPLSGEQDIFGKPWNPADWTAAALRGSSWSGGTWNGSSWSGSSWSGSSWSGSSWSGSSWSGSSWSGSSWSGSSWSGSSWSGSSWSGSSWSGSSWSGSSWSGSAWSSFAWS